MITFSGDKNRPAKRKRQRLGAAPSDTWIIVRPWGTSLGIKQSGVKASNKIAISHMILLLKNGIF
ncbi:MAG: hypothetical protein C5B49_00085 [Bdellovibrio sp.]|nr:MAG: hypothetical protein C5B49_00085 [Bdellovibrio sp.]